MRGRGAGDCGIVPVDRFIQSSLDQRLPLVVYKYNSFS